MRLRAYVTWLAACTGWDHWIQKHVIGISKRSGDTYQIIMRLQAVRGRVYELELRDLRRETLALEDLLADLKSVAHLAEEASMKAYASLCELVYSRLQTLLWTGELTLRALAVIDNWAASSEIYLRRPRFRPFARSVVDHLCHPDWGFSSAKSYHAQLIDAMVTS